MVKKGGTQYVCQECGNVEAKWSGRCGNCGAWNSLAEETALANTTGGGGAQLKTANLGAIKSSGPKQRIGTGIGEFDQVLGGGIVPGSIMLLAGEPGIGKSTLLQQVVEAVAKKQPVLYVSGEESLQQLKLRADRLGANNTKLELAASTSADDVAATIVAQDWNLVVVDSVQTMATGSLNSSAGSVSQITATAQLLQNAAKQHNTAVLLVGHVTKEGNIAGPKILEHLVDVVLYLEGERFGAFKVLRGVKNRFGSVDEVGIFEMQENGMVPVKNPSAAFLEERAGGDGSVVLATLEGSRALLVEVQALVSTSSFGYPKRTASGFDLNRLNLLVAVLGRRARVNLGSSDVYVNIVGGMKVVEPAADLAVALALASAAKGKPVADKTVVFGEVGLNGEIRSVSQVQKRLTEAKRLGFKQAVTSASRGVDFIKPVHSVVDAISQALSA